MNEAFSGDNETQYTAEQVDNKLVISKSRRRTTDRVKTAKIRALEPILEIENETN